MAAAHARSLVETFGTVEVKGGRGAVKRRFAMQHSAAANTLQNRTRVSNTGFYRLEANPPTLALNLCLPPRALFLIQGIKWWVVADEGDSSSAPHVRFISHSFLGVGCFCSRRSCGLHNRQARVFYLKAAARCNDSLLIPEPDNDQPCQWKRMHGLLLGMRAAVEGAGASTATASLVLPTAGEIPATGITCRTTLLSSAPEKTPPIERSRDVSEESVAPRSSLKRDAALTEFVADVVVAGADPPSSQPTPPPLPLVTELPLATAPAQASAPSTSVTPRGISTTAGHHSPPAVNGVEVAFGCLSHRQAAVREAAVGLLHAQAHTLGPRAALALYRRTVQSLELERKKETSEEEEEKGTKAGSRRTTSPCPLPGAIESSEAAAGAAMTSAGCGMRGVAKIGVRRADAGVPSEPSPAGARRKRDRIGALLDLLQRVVGQRGVLPHGTVGDSWERLFSVLRCVSTKRPLINLFAWQMIHRREWRGVFRWTKACAQPTSRVYLFRRGKVADGA